MMKDLKSWLKTRLRRALGRVGLEEQIRNASQELFGLSYWYEGNLWEPPVQTALRDLCKPDNVVFDVGANFGGLTTVMSRMVGPRGVVCAFEASPRIVDKCLHNLVLSGCGNVQVYHAAIWHTSFHKVPIYLGGHLNDSIYPNSDSTIPAYYVSTIALDDFVAYTSLVPNVVKMDIEGAEFDALKGMVNTISCARPHLILETQPSDTRCLDLLIEKGYIAIDLNTYREIRNPADYPKGAAIRNNLYIHRDKLSEVPYHPPFTFLEMATVTRDDFIISNSGSVNLKKPLALNKGRYLIDTDFTANGTENEMMCGVKVGEKDIFRYHAYTKLLAESYRDWVIDLPGPSLIMLYFDFLNGTRDESFQLSRAKITRVAEFDDVPPQLYV